MSGELLVTTYPVMVLDVGDGRFTTASPEPVDGWLASRGEARTCGRPAARVRRRWLDVDSRAVNVRAAGDLVVVASLREVWPVPCA